MAALSMRPQQAADNSSAPELVVRELERHQLERWDDFVAHAPNATVFHLSVWQDLMESVLRHRARYLYAEREGRMVGLLPLVQVRSRLFGDSLSSLPFAAYGGALGEESAVIALESAAEKLARSLGVDYLEYRNLQPRYEDWPRQTLYATFRKTIGADSEANLKAIPRKQRAMVRKGISRGLRSEIDQDVDRFFALYSDNVHRHGTPAMSKRYFAELKRRLGDRCEILTVTDGTGRPLSSVMSFYFKSEVLPYYAGDDVRARQVAANDFKYWELMRRAAERGCTLFDFGRSKVGTGPWSFKQNWGFEPQPLSYEYRLFNGQGVPQKNPMNPKYAAVIAAWRRLPLPVANLLGPPIARLLG